MQSGPTSTATTPIPWWMRMMVKSVSIIGGIVAILLSIVALVTINTSCVAAALLQLFIGTMILAFEAPVCCMCVECIATIADFSESRSHWQKSLLYMLAGLIPIVICFELATLFGSGLIFVTGVGYGMMAIGRRGRDNITNNQNATIGGSGHHVDAWDPNITIPPAPPQPPSNMYNQP